MKILLTSDCYTPTVNGVVRSVYNLKQGLEERGHEVKILTLSGSKHSFEKDGVIYISSLKADVLYPGIRLRVTSAKKYLEEILKWSPDVVHSNCEFCTFPLAEKIAKKLNIPLVHTYHTVYENYTHYFSPSKVWGKKLVKAFTRRIASRTDAIIAPTEKINALLEGYGVTTPVYVLPTGIDLKKYHNVDKSAVRLAMREKLGILPEHTVLIFVGRMAKEKNGSELIRMMTYFKGDDVRLLMVGDGPYREELEKEAEEAKIDKQVIFTGMVSPEQVDLYYQAGDLFVSASTSETQGLTYIEALSSGLPVLCRRDESLQGVVSDDVNGWQYETEYDFVKNAGKFLKHPERRKKMSENALATGQRFSISEFAAGAQQIYDSLIRNKEADISLKEILQEAR